MTENEQEESEKTEQEQGEPKKVEKTEEEKREDRIAWIRFIIIHVLVLIPAAIGAALITVGNKSNDDAMLLAGKIVAFGGVPGVMLILVIVVLTWKIRGIMKLKKEETLTQTAEREQAMLADVNCTHYAGSRAAMAEYEAQHIAEGMMNAPKWGLPVGIGIFLLFVADVVVATVLGIKGIFVGTIICMVLFAVACIIGLIFMSVTRARAANGDISKAKKITEGKVKSCFMVGTTTTKSGGMRGNGGTVRIHGVTYRVIVIADGEEYGAYSQQFYEKDKTVTIAVMGKKRAKIVENAEPETIDTECTTNNDNL